MQEKKVLNVDSQSNARHMLWFHIENASGGQELRPWTRVAVERWD